MRFAQSLLNNGHFSDVVLQKVCEPFRLCNIYCNCFFVEHFMTFYRRLSCEIPDKCLESMYLEGILNFQKSEALLGY